MNFQRQNFKPPGGGSDPGRWQVHIAVDPSEALVVHEASGRVWPEEHVELHTEIDEAGNERDTTLALRVQAADSAEAVDEAQRVYRKIRAAAGLGGARARARVHRAVVAQGRHRPAALARGL